MILQSLPLVEGPVRIGPCVGRVGKFMCIGLNYSEHAAETGAKVPDEPVLFMKATSAIVGPNDDLAIPRNSKKTDWEVELGVIIGDAAKYVDEAHALDHVAGYCVVHDVSEREFQLERGGTWDKGKGCDTFGPIGPWLVTKDEVADPQKLKLWLEVDGERMPKRHHGHDDFPGREARELPEPIHDAAPRRHDHDRHTIRRRHEPASRRSSCGRAKRCGWASKASASSSRRPWPVSERWRRSAFEVAQRHHQAWLPFARPSLLSSYRR